MSLKQTLAVCLMCFVHNTYAQYIFNGLLTSKSEKSPVDFGRVSLMQDGTVVKSCITEKDGKFNFPQLPDGTYRIQITAFGYEDIQDSLVLNTDCTRNYELVEKAINLDEVVVEGDRSEVVKRTANGQVFFLSKEAKKMRNPFEALQEIPTLISDPNSSSVRLRNGTSPLILIDGYRVNSGIAPISPSEIETVEIIDVTSARYLQEGISSIINIKLKKKRKQYIWTEFATRHDFPINTGFGVGYFEVGNAKYSLYGRSAYTYTEHDDIETSVDRGNSFYQQNYETQSFKNANDWVGELLFKYKMSPKDYLASHVYYNAVKTKGSENGVGVFTDSSSRDYKYEMHDRNWSGIFTSSIYYKHDFTNTSNLEVRFNYNFNKNNYNAERNEAFGYVFYNANILFRNQRKSGNLFIDYSKDYSNGNTLSFGSHSQMTYDKINPTNNLSPIFRHNELNQYLYGGYAGKIKDILYMLSVGVEGIWMKAGKFDNNYFRPRISSSATWNINEHNSMQLSYTLSNDAPSVMHLNPYNSSTDSLYAEKGNPYLTPQTMNFARINYTYNIGNLYLSPNIYYKVISDMLQEDGYTENGIYTKTYQNQGHFSQLQAGINANYGFKWGNIYGGGGWYANYFEHQSAKHILFASLGFNVRIKSFSFYGNLYYTSKDASLMSTVKYHRPTMANIQMNYNFTPDFYIALCLQHFTGEYWTRTTTRNVDYKSVVDTHYKDKNLRPWVLLRYTFRKNPEKKIKLGKVLNSMEQGISIK